MITLTCDAKDAAGKINRDQVQGDSGIMLRRNYFRKLP